MDDEEQVFGTDDETGIFVDYSDEDCNVYFKYAGEVVPPTRSAVYAIVDAVNGDD